MRYLLIVFSLFILSANAQENVKNYQFKFKINGTEGDTLYMANYLGKKLYYYDTAYADKGGITIFKGNEIPGGIYAIVTPGPKYFEIVVNEPKIELETNIEDFTEHMNVKISEENKAFYEYINFVNKKKIKSIPLAQKFKDTLTSEKEKEELRQQLEKIDAEVKAFQENFEEKHFDKLFAAKILSLNHELKIPEAIGEDSRYVYYKTHFLDNLDLNDDRFAHSPAFINKIERYFTEVLQQHPDTIYTHAFKLIDQIRDEKSDTWKLLVHYVTNTFEHSKIMGMDKVFVKMGQKYYCNEGKTKAYWMPEDKLTELCEKVAVLEHLLIGEKAPNLILQDTTEQNWINLHKDVNADFTILVFWDPDCGHCKKEVPKINDIYLKLRDSINLKVVGVGGLLEMDKWKTFIREKELNDWIHISDNPEIHNNAYNYLNKTTIESLNFRQTYDIYSYPQVYLLDENKVILAKKLGADSLEKVILNYSRR